MFLNVLYNLGNAIGPVMAYTFVLLMVIEIVYVWVKYVITSDK